MVRWTDILPEKALTWNRVPISGRCRVGPGMGLGHWSISLADASKQTLPFSKNSGASSELTRWKSSTNGSRVTITKDCRGGRGSSLRREKSTDTLLSVVPFGSSLSSSYDPSLDGRTRIPTGRMGAREMQARSTGCTLVPNQYQENVIWFRPISIPFSTQAADQ